MPNKPKENDRLRGILEYYFGLPDKEGFYKACGIKEKYRNYCSIDQALSQIKQWMLEILGQDSEGRNNYWQGYNQRGQEIRQRLEEL